MITPGHWRHPDCLDIDFYITKVNYRGSKYYKFKVFYAYRRSGMIINPFPESVELSRERAKEWIRIK